MLPGSYSTSLEQLPDGEPPKQQRFRTSLQEVRTYFGESQQMTNNLQQETGNRFRARTVENLKICIAAKLNRKHKHLYSFVTKEPYVLAERPLNGTCGFKITEPRSHYVEIAHRCTARQGP